MYKRCVKASILLVILAAIGAGVVASFDPFNNGNKWLSGFLMAGIAIVGIFYALTQSISIFGEAHYTENRYFDEHGRTTIMLVIGGAFLSWVIADSVAPIYQSLVWTCYAAGSLAYILSALAIYMTVDHQEIGDHQSLRKIA